MTVLGIRWKAALDTIASIVRLEVDCLKSIVEESWLGKTGYGLKQVQS